MSSNLEALKRAKAAREAQRIAAHEEKQRLALERAKSGQMLVPDQPAQVNTLAAALADKALEAVAKAEDGGDMSQSAADILAKREAASKAKAAAEAAKAKVEALKEAARIKSAARAAAPAAPA